jgi:hypothetical protein
MKQQILAQNAMQMTIATAYAIRENPLPNALDWTTAPLIPTQDRKTPILPMETASATPVTAKEISIVMRMLTEVTRSFLNPISAEAFWLIAAPALPRVTETLIATGMLMEQTLLS